MYKIIFLDDEAITLKLLASAIDWRKHRIELCGVASDGEEGIALFRQVEPDIVITDIRMPRMSGIELAGTLRQAHKKVKIVLLSAYAEFEYPRSAISYDISEYLLKPLDEDKLEAAIVRIVQELDREQVVSSTIESYRLEQAEKQLQQLLVLNHSGGRRNSPLVLPDGLAAALEGVNTLIHCLCVTNPHELSLSGDVEVIRQLIKEQLGPGTAVAAISRVELIVLMTSRRPGQVEGMLQALRRQAHPIVAGVSLVEHPLPLATAHRQAAVALDECFYAIQEVCCYSPSIADFTGDIGRNLASLAQPVQGLVEQGKGDELAATLQEQITEMMCRRVEPALIIDFVFDVLSWVKLELTKQQRTAHVAGLETISRERLRACVSSRSLVAYLNHLLPTIGQAVRQLLAEEPGYYIVRQAKDYTRQHYAEAGFALEDVATHVGLSKNHFSQIFHKVTGQKFWDYVTQVRIDKAKELLKQSNCSNYEICRAIGYESEYYFSKIFKKVVGVAAQQYRKM